MHLCVIAKFYSNLETRINVMLEKQEDISFEKNKISSDIYRIKFH